MSAEEDMKEQKLGPGPGSEDGSLLDYNELGHKPDEFQDNFAAETAKQMEEGEDARLERQMKEMTFTGEDDLDDTQPAEQDTEPIETVNGDSDGAAYESDLLGKSWKQVKEENDFNDHVERKEAYEDWLAVNRASSGSD